jgi:hypothetical protein
MKVMKDAFMKSNSENSELFRENIRLEEENRQAAEGGHFRLDCLLGYWRKKRSGVLAISD